MAMLDKLQEHRERLEKELGKIEANIAELELNYLQSESSQCGTVLKGFEGFLSSKDSLRKRVKTWKAEDRIFSLSSRSSTVVREIEAQAAENGEYAGGGGGGFGRKGYAHKGYAQKGYGHKGYPQKGTRGG